MPAPNPDAAPPTSSLRILMLCGEYPPAHGGLGDYTSRLAAALSELGHEVRVLAGFLPDMASDTDSAWRRVRDWGFGSWRQVERALDESVADVLHIQYQPGAYQLKGAVNFLPLWLRLRRPRLRIVTTFHDLRVPYLFWKAGPLRYLAVRALLQGSHGAIFVDPADLARVGPASNRRWVPIGSNIPCAPPAGFEAAAVRKTLGASSADLLIGYFGFLSAGKGVSTLLKALRLLLDRDRRARLVLIGAAAGARGPAEAPDEEHSIGSLARQLGLGANLRSTGYLPPAEVSAHLLACDIVGLPFKEGASFRHGSLMAALEHGRATVTTLPPPEARGSGHRLMVAGRHFLAVAPNDPLALANAMARLGDDAELAARLGSEGRALAARCSWNSISRETAEVYAEIAGPSVEAERGTNRITR